MGVNGLPSKVKQSSDGIPYPVSSTSVYCMYLVSLCVSNSVSCIVKEGNSRTSRRAAGLVNSPTTTEG